MSKFACDNGVEVDEGRDRSVADGGKEEEDGEGEEGDEVLICDLVVKFDTSPARDGQVRCRAGSMGAAPKVTGATVEADVREPGNGWRSGDNMGMETIKPYLI
ncbi:hypothetical protein RJZ56_005093 [Blastomyces dermatitidis]